MLTIQPIPAFDDNYIWLLYDEQSHQAFVVDPGDATPVIHSLRELQLDLDGVMITHHHFDHVGGLEQLRAEFDPVVFGPHTPTISGIDQRLGAGDNIEVLGLQFKVLEVPGHTLDHIAYFHASETPLLFCGDTLFAGGCGRVFEGTPPMMLQSLQILAALPPATRVYCAHEYTQANAAFALSVEPENPALMDRAEDIARRRSAGRPTVPTSIGLEKATNPFLRPDSGALQRRVGLPGGALVDVFAETRRRKDSF